MDEISMPAVVLSVVIALIMLGVGVFAFYVTYSEIGYTSSQVETFNVTDPTVTNSFELQYQPTSITLVEQYNGIQWVNVGAAFYSTSGEWFSILPGGMQG